MDEHGIMEDVDGRTVAWRDGQSGMQLDESRDMAPDRQGRRATNQE